MSPAIDLIYHIFTATDKPLRDAEYMNLLRYYHDSLSHMIKQLGSDPNKLFTFDNLLDEMKMCGNFAFIWAPMVIAFSLADSDKIINDNNQSSELIMTLSDRRAVLEFEKRINGTIGDLVDLGYFTDFD